MEYLASLAELDLAFILTVFIRDMELHELAGLGVIGAILLSVGLIRFDTANRANFGPSHTDAFPGD
jgi:hypothetical protein